MALNSRTQLRVKDRISDLPDSLLCHILSFIPTKYSVRTSTLSTRWRRVWASVPCLDFDDMHFPTWESFLLFVSRVLYFRNSLHIKKFDLTCNGPELFSHIHGWIRTALMQNLVEPDLCVENEDLGRDMIPKNELLKLPKSLFMCKTLVVLKLWSPFIINTPSSWCLPCLKVMFITINYPDSDLMEWLLPGCPALEDLSISGHGGDGSLNLNISAVELMKLRIKFDTLEDNHLADFNDLNVFVKLEYFGLEQTALSNIYFLEDSKFLVKASIDLNYCMATDHPGFAGRATALLAQICNEEFDLPVFGKFEPIEVGSSPLLFLVDRFAEEITKSTIFCLRTCCKDCNCVHVGGYSYKETELLWDRPEFVPNCLLSKIKTICIKEFKGLNDELEVAKYLLKSGEVLNSMKVYGSLKFVCTKEEMLEKFLLFDRGS